MPPVKKRIPHARAYYLKISMKLVMLRKILVEFFRYEQNIILYRYLRMVLHIK